MPTEHVKRTWPASWFVCRFTAASAALGMDWATLVGQVRASAVTFGNAAAGTAAAE